MNKLFLFGVLVVLGLVGVAGYWYMNPHKAPGFLRGNLPAFEFSRPTSPMSGFRPPQF